MNAEIQKYASKCEKYRQKIAEFQALLEEAERKKTEAENIYIIAKVRGSGYTADELMEAVLLLKAHQKGSDTPMTATAPTQPQVEDYLDNGDNGDNEYENKEDALEN